MRWIDKAREVAKEYRDNCQELERIQANQTYLTGSGPAMGKSGKIAKPVERAVEQQAMLERMQYLKKATGAVDYALEQVLQKPNGAVTLRMFQMVYWSKEKHLYGAAQALHISERTIKRYNRYLLKEIAVHMGFINFSI